MLYTKILKDTICNYYINLKIKIITFIFLNMAKMNKLIF